MIRYGKRLVLSELDIRRWTRITGFEPTHEVMRSCSAKTPFLEWAT
jgi:tricorn protease-like protein